MAARNEQRETWKNEIDAALRQWQQGDYVLGEYWFVHRYDSSRPLTKASEEVAGEEGDLAESEVAGFAIVTQTCDIIRSCLERPFIEVVPLIKVEESVLRDAQRSRRPQLAFIPGALSHSLVADLDRVMTVEKAVVAGWERNLGCQNDQEIRSLGLALARKRIRFAFPDDFVEWSKKLQDRFQSKHNKLSPEGAALQALREIRVRAVPSWDSPSVQLSFFFIRHEEDEQFQGIGWDAHLCEWLKYIPDSGRFTTVETTVTTLEDLSAKEYVESDPLDLDHLSG